MVGDVMFAGYALTPDEWSALDDDTRVELLAASGEIEVDLSPPEDGGTQLLV